MSHLGDSYSLDIYGDGPEMASLRDQIRELEIGNRVTLRGHVPNASELLPEYDVVVQTSFAETFGYALMEAADAGLPTVAIAMPVMDSFIPDYVPGRVVSADPVAIAAAIEEVMQSGVDFDEALEKRRQEFSVGRIVAAWRDVALNHPGDIHV